MNLTTAELSDIYRVASSLGFGGLLGGVFAYLVLTRFFPAYLATKGQNTAMREDVAELTRLVEDVRQTFNKSLEDHKAVNQMRAACFDARLRAHQEAYALWRDINQALGSEEIYGVVQRCDEWWGKNCLYLEPDARKAFLEAFVGARDLSYYKSTNIVELISQTHVDIQAAGGVIERCVALPELGSLVFRKPEDVSAQGKR